MQEIFFLRDYPTSSSKHALDVFFQSTSTGYKNIKNETNNDKE